MFGPSLHNVLHIQSDSRRGIHQKQNAKVWIYWGWIYFENLPKWSPSPAIIVVLIGNLCLIPGSIIGRGGRWPGTNGYNGVKRRSRGPPPPIPELLWGGIVGYCGYCGVLWGGIVKRIGPTPPPDTSPTPENTFRDLQQSFLVGC